MGETASDQLQPLRARDERIILLLMTGRTPTEICAEIKISRTTLWRLRSTEEFQRQFTAIRRQAFGDAVATLHGGAVIFAKTLMDVATDTKARGSERATAARSGLDSLFRAAELFDHEERLRKLEQSLATTGDDR